jgi:hypothetical protein
VVAQSVLRLATAWTTTDATSSLGRDETFHFPIKTLGPIQPPIEWIPSVLSPGLKRIRVKLITHLPSINPLPNTSSWRSAPLIKDKNNFILYHAVQISGKNVL